MNLQIQLKRLGKKKVHHVELELDCVPSTLQELIESCVRAEVTRYNQQRSVDPILLFLTPTDIENQLEMGKVKFADISNTTLAKQARAIEDALLAFSDGLFVVFVDNEQLTMLDSPVILTEKSEITFIRMTFLAGTYW